MSAFSLAAVGIVACAPGGSAVLHRSPTSSYVLVHVLSGVIRAQAGKPLMASKAVSELAAGGGFTGKTAMGISEKFDTNLSVWD